ncbi:MAG TPA: RidA family protein [Vicinamibacteria bacterium]|nr:RidA family protein [Vicinamibacteria bacterium]
MERAVTLIAVLVAGVAVAASLGRAQAASARRYFNLPSRAVSGLPFSDAVLAGDTLYIAGRIALDPVTRKPPAEAEQEARQVLDQVKQVLGEAGMTMDDLVSVTVYCSDVKYFDTWNKVYPGYFSGRDYPARAFIGAGPLLFGARFEVQGIAVRR